MDSVRSWWPGCTSRRARPRVFCRRCCIRSICSSSEGRTRALLVQPRLYGTRPGNPWGPAGAEAVTGFAGILGIASIIAIAIDAIARRRFRDREVFFVIAAIGIFILLANVKPAVAAMHAI